MRISNTTGENETPASSAWVAPAPIATKSKKALARATVSQTMQNILRMQQFERENGHLEAALMNRVVLARWKCLFLDNKTEELFGVYSYYDRIRRMNLGCLLFLLTSMAYMFSVISTLGISSIWSRVMQMSVILAIYIVTLFEKRSLEGLDLSPLDTTFISNLSSPVVSRATSPLAGRLVERLALFLFAWCALTLILVRIFDENWPQSPTSLIFMCWCGPLVLRLYFRHALIANTVIFFLYSTLDLLHNPLSIFMFHSMSLFSSAACGIILCYSSSMYRRMQLRSIIVAEHVNRTSMLLSPIYILHKERELRIALRLQYRRMKFIDDTAEKEYIEYITSRSRFFITVSLIFMIISNTMMYVPVLTVHEETWFSQIRTYVGLPIWMIASILIFHKSTSRYRVGVTTTALILTLLVEYLTLLPLSYAASEVYFLYIFRVLDVTSTSFCLPLRAALLIYGCFGVGSCMMPLGGNVYFSYISNLIFVPATIGAASYVSSVSHTDSRIAFLQKRVFDAMQATSTKPLRLNSIAETAKPKTTELQMNFLQITEADVAQNEAE